MKVEEVRQGIMDVPVWLIRMEGGQVFVQRQRIRTGSESPLSALEEVICALCTHVSNAQSESTPPV